MNNHISRRTFIIGNTVGLIASSIGASAQTPQARTDFSRVKALVFDTFGTVVDCRSSVTQQVQELDTR